MESKAYDLCIVPITLVCLGCEVLSAVEVDEQNRRRLARVGAMILLSSKQELSTPCSSYVRAVEKGLREVELLVLWSYRDLNVLVVAVHDVSYANITMQNPSLCSKES